MIPTISAAVPALRPAAGSRAASQLSIDDLDAAICRLARQINAESYRLLLLVREFDDRVGWAKWSYRSCAEWLAWRCGLTLSAAREKVRTAQALRGLAAISAAFAEGRLSYSKVRALTRAAQVEERCRQIRNVAPHARSARVHRRRPQIIIKSSCTSTEKPSAEGFLWITPSAGRAGQTCPSKPLNVSPVTAA
jgi:hypothetical protein